MGLKYAGSGLLLSMRVVPEIILPRDGKIKCVPIKWDISKVDLLKSHLFESFATAAAPTSHRNSLGIYTFGPKIPLWQSPSLSIDDCSTLEHNDLIAYTNRRFTSLAR